MYKATLWLQVLSAVILVGIIIQLAFFPPPNVHAQVKAWRQSFTSATLVEMNIDPLSNPIVQCFDGSGFWILPATIQVLDSGLVRITFSSSTTGRCVAK